MVRPARWLARIGESAEQTLRRELVEECGVAVAAIDSWLAFDFDLDRASDGSVIDFRHRGQIALVRVVEPVRLIEGVEDVARVVLLAQHSNAPIAPTVRLARRLLEGGPLR